MQTPLRARCPATRLAGGTTLLALAAFALTVAAHAAPACSARSAAGITPVVELYTSEGCSSCPPADRWLSRLEADSGVVALAFHVDYWDRLGWKDRFASPAYTHRQAQQHASSGARFSYTPQVLLDGADRPDWPRIAASLAASLATSPTTSLTSTPTARGAAPVDLELVRDGNRFNATVAARGGAPARLAAYWAVTEHGHVSAVKSGENEGATLRHDHVVREYLPVAAWSVAPESRTTLTFAPATPNDPAHPRDVNLVIVNAASGRPVQALKLGC